MSDTNSPCWNSMTQVDEILVLFHPTQPSTQQSLKGAAAKWISRNYQLILNTTDMNQHKIFSPNILPNKKLSQEKHGEGGIEGESS